jgi:nitrite reductase/ring-hydroxylating ferredoxin subunit
MGDLLRQYWIPAVRSDELEPDSPPLRVRVLCEDLIAFRATSGRIGLVENSCRHRGASLFFGRNEEEGLRCVYHGWKFDVTGACVDMPSEPAESNFKSKVRARTYPTQERGGIVWAYMGPRETPPPLPDLEPNMTSLEDGTYDVRAILLDWNWVQAIENRMDTAHVAFLHYGSVPQELADDSEWARDNADPEMIIRYIVGSRAPTFLVRDTDFGCSYAAYREAEADTDYYRTAHFLFPFITMGPGATKLGSGCRAVLVVPVDDEHTMEWSISNVQSTGRRGRNSAGMRGIGTQPNTTDWLGRFRAAMDPSDDFGIDREVQASFEGVAGFTGLATIDTQDRVITWSQGPRFDRSQEHLGTTDVMVIRVRERLLDAAMALRDKGTVPPGVDSAHVYRQRSGWVILPRGVDYWEATRPLREAFALEQLVEAAPRIS